MDYKNIPVGKNVPEEVNVFIEMPRGSTVKYELDKDMGVIVVDRFGYTAMPYPFDYGFVPNTLSEDGDPIDVLVLASQPLNQGVVIPVRPIGMLEMEDESGVDTKIIAVPTKKIDPYMSHIEDIADINESVKKMIQHFFDHYKELEPNKWVKTKNFLSKQNALDAIKKAVAAVK